MTYLMSRIHGKSYENTKPKRFQSQEKQGISLSGTAHCRTGVVQILLNVREWRMYITMSPAPTNGNAESRIKGWARTVNRARQRDEGEGALPRENSRVDTFRGKTLGA